MPLAVVVAGATRHAVQRLAAPLDAVVVERPGPPAAAPRHGCLDQGDEYDACRQVAAQPAYIPHMRCRGEDQRAKRELSDYRARRWVVEGCHAGLNRFRKPLVRFEKKLETHLAPLPCACADIVLKQAQVFR